MKKKFRFFFFLLLISLILNGCKSNKDIDNKDIFQFKSSYVGDNNAVGNIIRGLPSPNGEQLNGFELKTTKQPYGITINYIAAENTEEIKTNYKELALYNASFIFTLIQNADWVKFNFVEREIVVNREDLQNFYAKDVREFNKQEELILFIQEHLEDVNKVNQFYD